MRYPEHDPFGNKLIGHVFENKEIDVFKLNSGMPFDNRELVKVIRFNKHLFGNEEIADKLQSSMQRFRAKVQQQIVDSDDFKGKADREYHVTIKLDELKENELMTFRLHTNIYVGDEKQEFTVEIRPEMDGKSVIFFLESPEYELFKVLRREFLIQEVVQQFIDAGVCVLQVG